MTVHTRVAIIGGGIYGCGLLLQLVEQGWHDVTLVEKNELTAGSTWHAAGFCTHYSFNPTHVFMRQFSTDLYRQLEREGTHPTGYHRCRGLRITHDPDRIDEFHHGASIGRQFGIDFEVIGPDEIRQVFPLMGTSGLLGALLEPTDGYVDPTQATQAMAALARAGGATILRQSRVTDISTNADGAWVLTTPEQQIIAEHIVCAAGFWAHEVGNMMGLNLPITPLLHQYLVTADHPDIAACAADSIPLVRHHDYQWYTRRERDGLVLGAYEENAQTWSVDTVPANFGMELMQPDLDRVAHLMDDAMQRIPALADAGIKTVVHGPVSYSADGQPLIGPAPGLRNAWLACGSGFGIGEGAGAGKLLAEWIVNGQPPMHMGAFDPRRFGSYADRDYRVSRALDIFANQFATHYPLEEREAGRPRKTSPIHQRLSEAGAQFGAAFGWERPNWFNTLQALTTSAPVATTEHSAASGTKNGFEKNAAQNTQAASQQLSFRRTAWFNAVARECRQLSAHAGVIDFTGFAKFKVVGRAAEIFLDNLSANTLPQQTGQIRLCHFLNSHGRVECEFTVTRVGDEQFYLVGAAWGELHHLDWMQQMLQQGQHQKPHRQHGTTDVSITNVTQQTAVTAIAGPAAQQLLQPLCKQSLELEQFPWLEARHIEVAGCEVLALRVSYTGEAGWELHSSLAQQPIIYAALKARPEPPVDVGFYAVNAMRMEKAYKAWGAELTVENSIRELGLERFVVTDNRQFIGRAAVLADREQTLTRRFYYCAIDTTDSDPIGGEAIFQADQRVGVLVSGAYGHRVGYCIGFALLDIAAADNGQALQVEMLGEWRQLTLIAEPAFDAQNRRPRGLKEMN